MSKQCLGPTRRGHYNEVVLLKRWPLSEVSLYNTKHTVQLNKVGTSRPDSKYLQ